MIQVEILWGQIRDEEDWIERVPEELEKAGIPVVVHEDGRVTVSKGLIKREDDYEQKKSVFTWECKD